MPRSNDEVRRDFEKELEELVEKRFGDNAVARTGVSVFIFVRRQFSDATVTQKVIIGAVFVLALTIFLCLYSPTIGGLADNARQFVPPYLASFVPVVFYFLVSLCLVLLAVLSGNDHIGAALGTGDECALVVVDVQRDFCATGALEVPDADSLISPVNRAIDAALGCGVPIIYTRDWHPPDHSSFDVSGGRWPTHCVRDSPGADFHPGLKVSSESPIVDTGTRKDLPGYSPFETGQMEDTIQELRVGTIFVTGIALDFCVKETCLDSRKVGLKVVLLEDLCRPIEQDRKLLDGLLQELRNHGVYVTSTEKVAWLQGRKVERGRPSAEVAPELDPTSS